MKSDMGTWWNQGLCNVSSSTRGFVREGSATGSEGFYGAD